MAPQPRLFARQSGCEISGNCDDDGDGFWWSNEGYYVRYAIVAAIFLAVIVFILFAYFHAQRRVQRGLPPLRYHAWLLRRSNQGQRYPGPTNAYAYYDPNNPHQPSAYPMNGWQQQPVQPGMEGQRPQGWAPPPPAYGQHQWDTPPVYQPPPGASKASADQNVRVVNREVGEGSSGLAAPMQTYQAPRNENVVTQ